MPDKMRREIYDYISSKIFRIKENRIYESVIRLSFKTNTIFFYLNINNMFILVCKFYINVKINLETQKPFIFIANIKYYRGFIIKHIYNHNTYVT